MPHITYTLKEHYHNALLNTTSTHTIYNHMPADDLIVYLQSQTVDRQLQADEELNTRID